MKKKLMMGVGIASLALLVSACSNGNASGNTSEKSVPASAAAVTASYVPVAKPVKAEGSLKEFTLTAKPASWELKSGVTVPIWGFEGQVPGPQIRVTEGDTVRVTLKNQLSDPTTIHWHGIPLPNSMDGIPGVTQNAVQPGKEFTYEFKAEDPGTYLYHSHQDGVNQLDMGMYGTLVVEPKNPKVKYDRDYTLVLDEWITGANSMEGMDMSGNNANDMSSMPGMGENKETDAQADKNETGMDMDEDDMSMYNVFSINGKAYPDTEPLKVRKGERVKIRLANMGYMAHKIHIHGQEVTVTDTDGQPVNNPKVFKDQLISVAPGERYDVEFVANNPGNWLIECHGNMEGSKDMKVELQYEDAANAQKDTPGQTQELPEFTFASYGSPDNISTGKALFKGNEKFDVDYTAVLGSQKGGEMGVQWTINGKAFPETEPIKVKKGDKVKIRFKNISNADHPMHLHGHFFQVLSKNGKPLTGSPIIKDTINVRPGGEYEIAFVADNPGDWLLHCHDLHHASGGMVTLVKYDGFKPGFTVDPNAGNKPE